MSLMACSIQVVGQQEEPEKPTEQRDRTPTPPSDSTNDSPVEHIFFHTVIAHPELAFDQDSLAKGYSDYKYKYKNGKSFG